MTKKHYEAIAAIMRSQYHNAQLKPVHPKRIETIETTITLLAAYFAADNVKFDKYKFYEACGIQK